MGDLNGTVYSMRVYSDKIKWNNDWIKKVINFETLVVYDCLRGNILSISREGIFDKSVLDGDDRIIFLKDIKEIEIKENDL